MNRLATKHISINTAAGPIVVPFWLEPFATPSEAELRSLHMHIYQIGLPIVEWKRIADALGVDRVRDIRSFDGLLAAWLWVCDWQRANGLSVRPKCSWGGIAMRTVVVKERPARLPDSDLFGGVTTL